MGRTACTEPQCLYKGVLYLYLYPYNLCDEDYSLLVYDAVFTCIPLATSMSLRQLACKRNGNVHPRTGHEGLEGE
jgi:hypothetical protein